MKMFIRSRAFRALAIIVVALLIGTVIAVATEDSVSPVSTAVGTVFKPVQTVAGKLTNKFKDFGRYFSSSKSLSAEIERLEQQIEQYELQLADYDELQHKINSYEDILELKDENPGFELKYSTIIGMDTADAFGSFVIDKGENDGVKINDPVVTGNYLVGLVKKVNQSYSVVETILNPDVNVSAMETKTRETSYVTSTIADSRRGKCVFAGLERTTAVSPGGIVETSGIGGIFPKGLIIGVVSQVLESEYDITNYAIVTPSADLDNLEDVFVITSFEGQGVAVFE